MSNSKFEYVKAFESHNELLKNTFIVIRIDGRGFTKFCDEHQFEKPNDIRGIKLMNLAALTVMNSFNEIFIAYGESDEYSFAFRRDAKMYNRRGEKILTYLVSIFTSAYVFNWSKVFDVELKYPPLFDGRIILYPSFTNLKDYFSWRQVDCHINNLYNTTFWALVQKGGLTKEQTNNRLKGTFSKDKNEILFKDFNINYNKIEEVFKRGTILFKKKVEEKKEKGRKEKLIKETEKTSEIEMLQGMTEKIDLNSEVLIPESNDDTMLINLTDKLLSNDEKYFQLISFYYQQNIFITHEDLIQEEFWKKYQLDNY